jgi:hypothetical protein
MPDTVRTISTIMALLADNTTGDISPQDLRDAVETLRPDYGHMYVSTPASTTIGVAGTYVKAAGTTALVSSPASRNFTMPADNRLRYDGAAKRIVFIFCQVSVQHGASDEIRLRLAKNGTTLSQTQLKLNAAETEYMSGAMFAVVEMVSTDYVEVWITNQTDTSQPTVSDMSLLAVALPIQS